MLIAVCALLLVSCAQETSPTGPQRDKPTVRVLVFSKTAGFRHTSIPAGIKCVREVLGETAEVEATEDSSRFTDKELARFTAVVFLSTTGDVLDSSQQDAFRRF
ncbi:MAG: ThuA domain-containing protein, partial [Phycisphaerae bacterium]|nr:ThuA domain-containing protein [Phycisphaerae bacterium]